MNSAILVTGVPPKSPSASIFGRRALAETLRSLCSNHAQNRDLLWAKNRIILAIERFTDSAGLFSLGGLDEFALVQRVLTVIVDIMEGHYASPRQRERDECLSGTDSLEALRRRCGEDAPKAAAYRMQLRKFAQEEAEAETPAAISIKPNAG